MNEQTIQGLWSASKTLADQAPLNKEESNAVRELLANLLSTHIPTPQEIKRYYECKDLLRQCTSEAQKEYFIPTIEQYENNYTLMN